MSLQNTFNIVWKHASQMTEPAHGSIGKCMYRTPQGQKCLAGCLIPDEKYDQSFETFTCEYEPIQDVLTEEGHHASFVYQLQLCHDEAGLPIAPLDSRLNIWHADMMDKLRKVAKQFKLTVPEKGEKHA